MQHRSFRLSLVAGALALSLVAAACGGDDAAPQATTAAVVTTDKPMVEDSTDESMVDDMTDESMVDDSMELSAWQTTAITDVDGSTFTLADFAGRPVLVETFATWCPKCRTQLGTTNEVAAAAGVDAVVIALSVETDITADDVRSYAADNGFSSMRFAVVTPELLAALVDAFGPSVANPPATPKFVIDAMGDVGELITGSSNADTLTAALGLN